MKNKPLGRKNYGSIPHLIGSNLGTGDHHITEGQYNILTKKTRDKHDLVIVTEKYDGSNVGVAKDKGKIIALTRSGYLAATSPFEQHHHFAKWVFENKSLFDDMLGEGDRIVGEWLLQAHGIRYDIKVKDPIVFFDYFRNNERLLYVDFLGQIAGYGVHAPNLIHKGTSCSVDDVRIKLYDSGCVNFSAIEKSEGVVYRVERKGKVDFLAKWVRSDFKSGQYLPELSGNLPVYNFDNL